MTAGGRALGDVTEGDALLSNLGRVLDVTEHADDCPRMATEIDALREDVPHGLVMASALKLGLLQRSLDLDQDGPALAAFKAAHAARIAALRQRFADIRRRFARLERECDELEEILEELAVLELLTGRIDPPE